MITNISFVKVSAVAYELNLHCSTPQDIADVCEHLNPLVKEHQWSYQSELHGVRICIPSFALYDLFLKLKEAHLLEKQITTVFIFNKFIELLMQKRDVKNFGNIEKFLSYYLPQEDMQTHIQIVRALLSSPSGLDIFSQILDQGFTMLDNPALLQPLVQLIDQSGQSMTSNSQAIQQLTSKYNQLAAYFEAIHPFEMEVVALHTEREMAQFFNRSWMFCYLQHYLFAPNEKNERIYLLQKDYLHKLIWANKLFAAAKYYLIAKLSGLSYCSAENLSRFAAINTDSHHANKHIFKFMLTRYELSPFNITFVYKYLAVQVINQLLEHEFDCDEEEVHLLLTHYYQVTDEARKIPNKATILEYALHAVVQLASIIAPRIGKSEHLKTFIKLARQLKPCLSIISLDKEVNTDPLLKAEHKVFYNSSHTSFNADIYSTVLRDLYQLMLKPQNFNDFFNYLNTQLSHSLGHLPSLPNDYQDNQIKLLDLAFPNGKIFSWWSGLPESQRALNQAMHHLLLSLERAEGYNLPDFEGTDGVPRFYGFIPHYSANSLITKEKRIFKESAYSSPGIIHGVEAHRLQLAALRFFIKEGRLKLPRGKSAHDLLTYIVDNDLWSAFFDNRYSHFTSPHFLMSALRSNPQYDVLQKYAVFAFCKAMSKFIYIDCPLFDYEQLILMQCATDNNFINRSDERLFKNWLSANKHKAKFYQEQDLWSACYFKKPKALYKSVTPYRAILNTVNHHEPFHFTGRVSVLRQIELNFKQQALQIISGMRGVGKTTLVNQYLLNTRYTICWPVETADIPQSLKRLYDLLQHNFPDLIRDIQSTYIDCHWSERLQIALKKIPNWLLIFDDIRSPGMLEEYMALPNLNLRQHIIITTTNPYWTKFESKIIYLDTLTDDEAQEYLHKVLPHEQSESLNILGKSLGNLPLGLVQSSNFIRSTSISVTQYLNYFKQEIAELWATEERPVDYPRVINAAWQDDIDESCKDIYAKAILFSMAYLSSLTFTRDLFLFLDEPSVARALRRLCSYSLLKYEPATKQYTLHPLVQAVIYEHLRTLKNTDYARLALVLAPTICDLKRINRIDTEIIYDYEHNSEFTNHILSKLNLGGHELDITEDSLECFNKHYMVNRQ